MDSNSTNLNNEMIRLSQLRVLLYENFYGFNNIINKFIEKLYFNLPVFSVDCDYQSKIFTIKIKKTEIKHHNKNFIHNSAFYYPLVNNALYSLFLENGIINDLCIRNTKYKEFFENKDNIGLLYNITTKGDNIVIIQL